MTGPTSTTTPNERTRAAKEDTDDAAVTRPVEDGAPPAVSRRDTEDLATSQEEVTRRARELVAWDLVASATTGGADDERGRRLLTAARADLLAELRSQEQERARRQLAQATRSSEDAVAGLVQGITTIVRSVVPAVLVRPEDVIEATFALADQGLRVGRRLALTVTSGVRSLADAA
ncbi:hypothetical protein [Geodermatophilus sp. CPCC 206100]|uniref:hypothetical protein n=1 Tax=Geodermatophilus sp. CPCC 206100 TaxID=3020054 RepID=UPI003B00AEFF